MRPPSHSRDDDHRPGLAVECLGVFDVGDVAQPGEREWAVPTAEPRDCLGVVAFAVALVDAGGAGRQRAVHVNRQFGNLALVVEFVEEVDELLGPADAEGGDDEFGAAACDFVDQFAQALGHALALGVKAIAVGALGDEDIAALDEHGVADDGHALAPEVAGEEKAMGGAVLLDFQFDQCRAEDVAGVVEGGADPRDDLERPLVGDGLEKAHEALDVGEDVKGLEGILALAAALLVDVFHVARLEVGGVPEHDVAEVHGGGRGIDRPAVATASQGGQVAAVVYVGVGEDDGVEVVGLEGEVAVALEGFLSLALVETTIEQDTFARDLQKVHRAGDRAHCAVEADFQDGPPAAVLRRIKPTR